MDPKLFPQKHLMRTQINTRDVLKYTQSISSEAMLSSTIKKPLIFCEFQYICLNR